MKSLSILLMLVLCGMTALAQQPPMSGDSTRLDTVTVRSPDAQTNGFSRLRDVEGAAIYAGKKSEVVIVKDLLIPRAINSARQIYSHVAGLNIWENDGAGLQLAIGGRGLNPNRVSNFNTRQNGYDISADALGYPESYYTPPVEAVERIEIVRGAAGLQHGTQFGGMINFQMNHGSDSARISGKTELSAGSFHFLNSSSSIGGTTGRYNYYVFYQHKSGDGWRPNAGFRSNTVYTSHRYAFSDRLSLTLQYTHMDYLEQQPGGLTDADFAANPRQSLRNRNWFRVDWNLAALILDFRISNKLFLNSRSFGLAAQRDAIGVLSFINRADDGSDRNLYIDHYRNLGNETRLLYQYKTGKTNATALIGFRYYSGHTHRQQGFGNDGSTGYKGDFRYRPSQASDSLRYSDYRFPNENLALFSENIFHLSPKLTVVPGIRWESIVTRADGRYTNAVFDLAGNPVNAEKIRDEKTNRRSFFIAGIGSTFALTKFIQLYANISQNYKAINFNDLRTLNPNLKVDSMLKDESGYSADIGIRKNAGHFHFDVSLFTINYNNKIGSILSTDTVNFLLYNLRTNIGRSRHFGIETYAEADLLRWLQTETSNTSLILFSNFSVIRARYEHTKDPAISGRRVEFVPQSQFKTGLTLHHGAWSAGYQFSYTGKQYTDATNAVLTANAIDGIVPAWSVMDFTAQYRFNAHLQLSGSVNNFTNRMYFTRRADSYPGPGIVPSDGRSFLITLQAGF